MRSKSFGGDPMNGNTYTLADMVTLVIASHFLTFTVWGLRALDRQDRRQARHNHPTARKAPNQ